MSYTTLWILSPQETGEKMNSTALPHRQEQSYHVILLQHIFNLYYLLLKVLLIYTLNYMIF